MELIEYVGNGFSVRVPAEWARLATPEHVAVFLGGEMDEVRSSMALTRFSGSVIDAASQAKADHTERFQDYELLHESAGRRAFYRRYAWTHVQGVRLLQHQLFVEGLLLTCSRVDAPATATDDRFFESAIRSLRVAVRSA